MKTMVENAFREDLYEILGLEPAADERQVSRAYKKKSKLYHPDRGGDVAKFLELTYARDILLDPKKKSAYDKKLSHELLAKKKQREREMELDTRRRQMRDELLRKEQSFERHRKSPSAKDSKAELSRFREKALARQQALQEKLNREAQRRSELKSSQDAHSVPKSQRTVTFKWDQKRFSHSDDTLSHNLRTYGEIEFIKMKTSSAKVVFYQAASAAKAVRIEAHKDCWRGVTIQGHIIETDGCTSAEEGATTKTVSSKRNYVSMLPKGPISLQEHLAFEKAVLATLREKAKLQQELQQAEKPTPV